MQSHARKLKTSKSFAHGNIPIRNAALVVDPGARHKAVLGLLGPGSDAPLRRRRLDGLVEEERLANVLDLGDCALEVECLGEDNLEYLGRVNSCASL
jgi:hypothetical protein